jgi:hypothetical protein
MTIHPISLVGTIAPGAMRHGAAVSTGPSISGLNSRVGILGPATWFDRSVSSRSLIAVWLDFNAIQANGVNVLEVTRQGLTLTTPRARPDGIVSQTATRTGASLTPARSWQRFVFDVAAPVAIDERLALVLRYSAFGTGTFSPIGFGPIGDVLSDAGAMESSDAGVTWTDNTGMELAAWLEFADGSFGRLSHISAIGSQVQSTFVPASVGSGGLGNGNERGTEFILAQTIVVSRLGLNLSLSAGASPRLRLYDEDGEVLGERIWPAFSSHGSTVSKMFSLAFPDGLTLEAGVIYRLMAAPQVSGGITLSLAANLPDAAVQVELFGTGVTFAGNSRTDPGAFGVADPLNFARVEMFVEAIVLPDPEPEPEPEVPDPTPETQSPRWHALLKRIKPLLAADATLFGIYGEAMRMAGTDDVTVPLLEWSVLFDSETELWEPVTIQFDQWLTDDEDLRRSEQRLRSLFHRPSSFDLDGIPGFAQYVDGAMLATPDRASYIGRAIRFRFTPLRAAYSPPS